VPLEEKTKVLLRHNDWFWVVTGVHQGGGLDCSLVIRKKGPPMLPQPAPTADALLNGAPLAAAGVSAASAGGCAAGCVDASALAEAQRALKAAEGLQAQLVAQQGDLAAQLKRAEAEAAARPQEGRAEARTDWPLMALLAVSMAGNIALWKRRHTRSASGVGRAS